MNYTAEGADAHSRLRAVGASLGLAVAGFVVPFVLALVVGTVLAGFGIPLSQDRTPLVTYPVVTIVQGLGFAVVVAGFLWLFDVGGLIRARLPTPRELGVVVAGLAGLLVALGGVSVFYSQFGVSTAPNRIVTVGRDNPEVMLYMLPLAVLVIGPTEELLFRGAIQGLLRRAYAAVPAIVIASLLFALAHITALGTTATPSAKAATLSAILVLSLLLGAIYEYTGNLVVPALVHGLYDAVIFAVIYVQAAGVL